MHVGGWLGRAGKNRCRKRGLAVQLLSLGLLHLSFIKYHRGGGSNACWVWFQVDPKGQGDATHMVGVLVQGARWLVKGMWVAGGAYIFWRLTAGTLSRLASMLSSNRERRRRLEAQLAVVEVRRWPTPSPAHHWFIASIPHPATLTYV